MGGRGKTPLTALVAQLLVEAGERPAILSRGYGRAFVDDGVTVVSDGHAAADGGVDRSRLADLAHSGDEPLMLARAVPGAAVLVCEQRALAGVLAENALGCTVHILDDGFQHQALRRDVDVVLVAPEDFTAKVLPLGRLREPADALAFADAVLIDGLWPQGQAGLAAMGIAPAFAGALTRTLAAPRPAVTRAGTVIAVAGIATPSRFFDALKGDGWSIAEALSFKDHHEFTAADARRIGDAAARAGAAAVVTTSKDVIKLETLGPWAVPLVEIPLEVTVESANEFRTWLLGRLAAVRR